MLNAVRRSLLGDTGKFLQNFGRAFSMSFLIESGLISDVDVDKLLWNNINIAKETR